MEGADPVRNAADAYVYRASQHAGQLKIVKAWQGIGQSVSHMGSNVPAES